MAKLIHDEEVRRDLERRLFTLTPDRMPRWGKMSVDQMLWHLSEAMTAHLTQLEATRKPPMPAPVMRFMVLAFPWPKSAPTDPALVAKNQHDFEEQRSRCLALMREIASRPISG